MKMKRIFLMVMFFLVSCTSTITKTPTESSIIEESRCVLPCWHGIVIGKTTKQEFLEILSNLPIVNQGTITIIDSKAYFDERVTFTMGTGQIIHGADNGGDVKMDHQWRGEVAILNDKVERIWLAGDLGLTLQQMFDIFGPPTYAIPSFESGGYIWIKLITPAQGVALDFRAESIESELTPDTKIEILDIFNPDLYDEMVNNAQFKFAIANSVEDMEHFAWNGYGKITKYLGEK
jgi:hypothetical protein